MIHPRYTPYVFSFFMALIMSCIMSIVISALNMGVSRELLIVWPKAWFLAFIVAFPTVLIVAPLVRKLVSFCVASESATSP